MSRHNIENAILITIDSLRADHVGCLGYPRETTPQLDKLAKKGILFRNAISNGGNTPASFRPILTSTPLSMYDDDRYLSKERITIQEVLKKKGYTTSAFHSNPYLSSLLGYNRGFDKFDEILELNKETLFDGIKTKGFKSIIYDFLFRSKLIQFKLNKLYKFSKGEPFARADTLNKLALSWLKQNPEKFFMWLHYMDVHTPYVPKKEYLKMFSSSSHNILTDLSLYFKLKKNISKKSADITKDDLKLLVDSYDAEIRYTDTQIGLLLNELGNMGLLEKTLIIITSDHGEGFFEHGVFGHFSEHLYDELIRVPLIIYAPGIGENIIVDEQVELLSIAPTINETLTNTEMDVFMGRSLFPIIRGEKEGTKGVISEASRTRIAYRESDWKFLLDKKTNKIEIYHLKDDPQEKNNIAQLQPEKVKEFRQKILDHECMTERKMMKRRIKKLKTLKKV